MLLWASQLWDLEKMATEFISIGKRSGDLPEAETQEQPAPKPALKAKWTRFSAGAVGLWDGLATKLANLRPAGHYRSSTRYVLVAGLIFVGLVTRWGLHSFFG